MGSRTCFANRSVGVVGVAGDPIDLFVRPSFPPSELSAKQGPEQLIVLCSIKRQNASHTRTFAYICYNKLLSDESVLDNFWCSELRALTVAIHCALRALRAPLNLRRGCNASVSRMVGMYCAQMCSGCTTAIESCRSWMPAGKLCPAMPRSHAYIA